MEIIRLTDIGSTNDYALNLAAKEPNRSYCVLSEYQSEGKGMGTNRWESEPGKNLLFSILVHPTWLSVSQQYLLSMAEAVALRDVLSEYADDITIKWPNDIYWRDRKLSGTRIDGNIRGRMMSDMVIGTGININQRVFTSDAPNPVSLWQIVNDCSNESSDFDLDEILQKILLRFEYYYEMAQRDSDQIVRLYHSYLYRRKGMHRYEDADGTFMAEIVKVEENGMLTLRRENGLLSRYEFKEVKIIHNA